MNDKVMTEHHLRFLSLKGGWKGSSVSTLVKMPHSWKSHAAAHMLCKVKANLQSLLDGLYMCEDSLQILHPISLRFCQMNLWQSYSYNKTC